MSIQRLIEQGAQGKAGTAGAWRVEIENWDFRGNEQVGHLYHYSTRMLTWRLAEPTDDDYLCIALGWGSVSDQNGMNTAFRVLGLPYRYDRAGGAEITRLHELSDEQMADVQPTVDPEAMSAACPCCSRGACKIRESFMQATRTEPMRSLGFQGYCPSCELAFKAPTPQLAMEALT